MTQAPSPNVFSPCAVIPVYRHAYLLEQVLPRIRELGLPCVVVNDGNDQDETERLRALCRDTGAILAKRFCIAVCIPSNFSSWYARPCS